ncbi:glycolipid transfer protein [Sanghuangporus baumii]|uniref:Glycolipid transfer protein n=1 Tax=Sanghuangporus baumii TaxID=108892 RepID=A0A9Q5NBV0_SANBA|nr:glycolipid transfer protein [Sanghuangporus baumii]
MFAMSFFRASDQSSRPNSESATSWKGSVRANRQAGANMEHRRLLGRFGFGLLEQFHSILDLLSGLLFTCRALQHVRANPHEEKFQPCFSREYDSVLRHHHGIAIHAVVQVALDGGSQEKLDEDFCRWLTGLDVLVRRMAKFYKDEGHKKI